jgi:hypothetical protein
LEPPHSLKILTFPYPEEENVNRRELTPILAVEKKLRKIGGGRMPRHAGDG